MEVKQKKLTRFLCQELLYEYAHGMLSASREKEVKDYIAGCRDTQREFERLKRGATYAERAKGSRVSPALREALLNFEPQWQKHLRVWTLWSSQRGWRMLPYIFVVLTVAAGLFVMKPWQKVEQPDVLLAEQLKAEPDMIAPSAEQPPAQAPQPEPAQAAQAIASAAPPSTPVAPAVAAKETQAKAPVVHEDAADDKAEAPAPSRGFIMRGELDVSDFSNTWPMIRDKIIALGGKVAGNVELGWLRRPDQSYFHFTIPESNYAELELFLGTFGPVRFSKERHPRVMPQGQIRIILTVKDAIIDESPAETP